MKNISEKQKWLFDRQVDELIEKLRKSMENQIEAKLLSSFKWEIVK